jgi:hypothetical protein
VQGFQGDRLIFQDGHLYFAADVESRTGRFLSSCSRCRRIAVTKSFDDLMVKSGSGGLSPTA